MAQWIVDMNNQNFKKQIHSIIQKMDMQERSLQSGIKEIKKIKQELLALIPGVSIQSLPPMKKIAKADGKPLSQKQLGDIKNNNYDVILNYIEMALFARKNPDKQTKLEECNCKNIGPHKLKLLRFMFEHPRIPICEETIELVYKNITRMSPGALAKAIGEIRKALWNAPYILTESVWGEYISHTGSVYMLNDKYRYLVIKYEL